MSTTRHNKQGILVMVGRRVGYLVLGKVTKRQGRRESLGHATYIEMWLSGSLTWLCQLRIHNWRYVYVYMTLLYAAQGRVVAR